MKKFAMMLMNPQFIPTEHGAVFLTGEIENHIITVRDKVEALEQAEKLAENGFGVLEVCGAFDAELVQQMRETTNNKLCIGQVAYRKEDEERLQEYWKE